MPQDRLRRPVVRRARQGLEGVAFRPSEPAVLQPATVEGQKQASLVRGKVHPENFDSLKQMGK